MAAVPSLTPLPLTGDTVIDATTNGYYWGLDGSRTIYWSIADGFIDEFWTNPSAVASTLETAFSFFSYYANVNFQYAGYFVDPIQAYLAGSNLTISMDGNNIVFDNNATWAIGFFPNAQYDEIYPGLPGDMFLNLNSEANFLSSYDPGSAGFFLAIHEIGHALGLKHPHDDGGTGRPTFSDLGISDLDIDWATIMSYNDDANWNLVSFDPATPMPLDVLALQYLYGPNQTTNSGDSIYTLPLNDLYVTIWDSSGNDAVDVSSSLVAWTIALPDVQLSELVPTLTGFALPTEEIQLAVPRNLYWLMGNIENLTGSEYDDTLSGNDIANLLVGGHGNDALAGGGGNDVLIGGAGGDTQDGGEGSDIYLIALAADATGDVFNDIGSSADTDELRFASTTASTLVLSGNETGIERVVIGTGSAAAAVATGTTALSVDASAVGYGLTITGNAGNNILTGGSGGDTLNGGLGNDTLTGGSGSDWADYAGSAAAVTVNLLTNTGIGGEAAGDSYTLIENIRGTGQADNLTGNAGTNSFNGGDGNDTLDGGTGADTLDGGLGNDLYVVDNAGDQVNELAGEGIDTVRVGFSYTLGNEVENLELTGVGNANGTGNALNNRLAGNSGNNILKGAAGNDTLVGGSGNDTYFVDSTGDVVSEAFGQGTDTVFSSVSLSANLAANVENLTLSGTALTGTGNNLNNVLTGNAQNNTLNAAFGEDSMAGGFGNDTYVVENINDVVTENSNAGTDTIQATINIGALAVNVENLTLILGALEGTGNELANVLTGNANNNTLSGGAGFDQLSGGAGADTMIGGTDTDWYILDNVNDQVIENAGAAEGTADRMFTFVSNTIAANVETMTLMGGANIDGTGSGNADRLHGNTGNNTLNGLAGNDVMDGLAGDDRLIGGLGLDNMTGSAGADTFVYTSLADSGTTGATRDLIQDFAEGTDKIDVTAIDAIAGGIDDAFTFLGTGAFTGTAGQLRYFLVDNAGVANDFTLVELDGDGNAAADSQITLRGLHTLTSNEFVL